MGIECVAVYSDADAQAPHVLMADKAINIGPAASSESYLRVDKILEAAKMAGADAIHPGYGFLSENAEFSAACEAAGLIFIGPSAESIRIMGDKTKARLLMAEHGVATPPGTLDAIANSEEAMEAVEEIGYPILIKAAAGGGGKGMRIVREGSELQANIEAAQREAKSAFSDGRVYIERFFERPRHIELQVAADQHGNVIHLMERECSIQRRHQKVIEEAPSSWLSEETRQKMGEAAILATRACDYLGVGTIEFLVDDKEDFFFMEMNTRLQVEHPVTEEITGVDLVREQINIAEGKPLSLSQDEVERNGHSIECRIYAEDPNTGFMPSPGTLRIHRAPGGPGVRVEAGVREGQEISRYYDPMISKLVVHAPTRQRAISKMSRALSEYQIAGVETTLSFCRFVMAHPAFVEGHYTTQFVDKYFEPETELEDELLFVIAGALLRDGTGTKQAKVVSAPKESNWRSRRGQ